MEEKLWEVLGGISVPVMLRGTSCLRAPSTRWSGSWPHGGGAHSGTMSRGSRAGEHRPVLRLLNKAPQTLIRATVLKAANPGPR